MKAKPAGHQRVADVLWSLSIEEVFYFAFPLLCLWLPRRLLLALLLAWALILVPLHDLVPASNEVWQEKAYLAGHGGHRLGRARPWRRSGSDCRHAIHVRCYCLAHSA